MLSDQGDRILDDLAFPPLSVLGERLGEGVFERKKDPSPRLSPSTERGEGEKAVALVIGCFERSGCDCCESLIWVDLPLPTNAGGSHFAFTRAHSMERKRIMKRVLASAVLASSLLLVGCDKKDDTSKQVENATDSTAKEAGNAMDKMKGAVSDGVDKSKEMAKSGADSAMAAGDAMQKQIDELISKAKTAVGDKKWDDADGYLTQIKALEAKLPVEAQQKIDASMADVKKMIDAGKSMMPGK